MLYLIRHGQRANIANLKEFTKIQISHDPHLTSIGEFMAYQTGEYICKENNYEKFPLLVMSSPYLRCIQTAENILKGIEFTPGDDAMQDNTIFLEDSLREVQGPEAFVDPKDYWNTTCMEHFALTNPDLKSFTLNPPKAEQSKGSYIQTHLQK